VTRHAVRPGVSWPLDSGGGCRLRVVVEVSFGDAPRRADLAS